MRALCRTAALDPKLTRHGLLVECLASVAANFEKINSRWGISISLREAT